MRCDAENDIQMQAMQTPWSFNLVAQAFAAATATDSDYLRRTWASQPGWQRQMEVRLRELGWAPNAASPPWVPWWGSYGQPAFLRLGVPFPTIQDVLFAAWAHALARASEKDSGDCRRVFGVTSQQRRAPRRRLRRHRVAVTRAEHRPRQRQGVSGGQGAEEGPASAVLRASTSAAAVAAAEQLPDADELRGGGGSSNCRGVGAAAGVPGGGQCGGERFTPVAAASSRRAAAAAARRRRGALRGAYRVHRRRCSPSRASRRRRAPPAPILATDGHHARPRPYCDRQTQTRRTAAKRRWRRLRRLQPWCRATLASKKAAATTDRASPSARCAAADDRNVEATGGSTGQPRRRLRLPESLRHCVGRRLHRRNRSRHGSRHGGCHDFRHGSRHGRHHGTSVAVMGDGRCRGMRRCRRRQRHENTRGPISGFMSSASARGGSCHGRLPTNRTIAPVGPKSGTLYT
ncbi:hypothetical protein BU14_0244s0003 [Porphyra umbilicalis]|uniref:Uncharacterized protein n=1 Tax=Porphyra umbilicalis TaxID=2786 RepID=A0A1X6P303_PORUM|nr:hypothetical protein BU14_0244s0003 [Porphyra umbilicalis]|eukprot:OSX75241.1 hypothetical protein BU14_0244s0003 [Porphyra umbilicalis]